MRAAKEDPAVRILVLALALLPAAAAAGESDPAARPPLPTSFPSGKACPQTRPEMAAPSAKTIEPRALSREPTAGQYYTVLRTFEGCELPTKIRDGIGDSREDQH
jgi:hypothetical protein